MFILINFLGHFCEKATVDPLTDSPCPIGTYMPYGTTATGDVNGVPAGRESDCLQCPGGSKCVDPGTVTPEPCDTGTFSKPGNSECETCWAGYVCCSYKTHLSCDFNFPYF